MTVGPRAQLATTVFVVALTACRARHAVDAGALAQPVRDDVATPAHPSRDERPPPPPSPPASWCASALPRVDARAIDRRGHRWALAGTTLVDETAPPSPATRVTLPPSDPPCRITRDALWFGRDGSAAAVARGRIYLRAAGAQSSWVETPMCTDLDGEPWAVRTDPRGWSAIGRRFPHDDAALLRTEDTSARVGWYATTALGAGMTSVLLEGSGSRIFLTEGGHLIIVDQERSVAGEVIAGVGALYDSMTRTGWGIVVARDVDPTTRELVVGTDLQRPFVRERRARPAGPTTQRVFALAHGELLATTSRGVEWSSGPGTAFVEVARWPGGPQVDDPGSHASFGWLDDGSPAVVFPTGWVHTNCTEPLTADQ